MRRVEWLFGLGALAAGGIAAAALVEGCTAPLGDCSKYAHVGCPGYGGSASSGTSSSGDSGTGGSTGSSSGGCTAASECPPVPAGPCASLGTATCTNGLCAVTYAPGPAPSQQYGNCQKNFCDATGKMSSVADDANVYQSGNECVAYACVDGGLTGDTIAVGATCSRPPPEPSPAVGACELNAFNVAVCAQCSTSPGGCAGNTPKCLDNMCVASTCGDGTLNGSETDKDCGGSACVPCAAGKTCTASADCSSKICMGSPKVCQQVSCSDGTQNGSETDVDCGGANCPACASGRACAIPSDCVSGVCTPTDGGPNACQAPTCSDGVQNGTETGIDCGGTCPPCADAG